jgi:DNA polymerase-3 subunit gamma/tau
MSRSLFEQYRPRTWAEVAGQDAAVRQVQSVLRRGWGGRAWWITGASGTGKSTLGKLIAGEGASAFATEEVDAGGLTPKGVRDLERQYASRPLPVDGKAGWCVMVNECHALRKDTVRALLDALERIPEHVCWVFTTTRQGQASFFEDDTTGDAGPLVSRCCEVELSNGSATRKAFARRAREIAQAEGLDGLPEESYVAVADECRGNMRRLLQRVESGAIVTDAERRRVLENRLESLRATKGEWAERERAKVKAALGLA